MRIANPQRRGVAKGDLCSGSELLRGGEKMTNFVFDVVWGGEGEGRRHRFLFGRRQESAAFLYIISAYIKVSFTDMHPHQ